MAPAARDAARQAARAMKTWSLSDRLPDEARGAAVALGNFDGLHPGHRAVIGCAAKAAKHTGAPLAVATFEPAPRRHFQPEAPPFRLMTPLRRDLAFKALGVDHGLLIRFDADLARMTDRDFAQRVLHDAAGAAMVCVGFDFRFGRNRMGDAMSLAALGAEMGFTVEVVDEIALEGEKASSTRIREMIEQGEVDRAARALGGPWIVDGMVEHGEKRGRTLGFPTANMRLGELVHPAFGVYAVWARIDGESLWRPAVASFGRTPTTGLRDPILETMLLDFDGDLYGRRLHVAFARWIRPELRFDGLGQLVAAMGRDVAAARQVLSAAPAPVGL
jgi:riboflavin kinase/FMN adenylyltransferase